MLLPRFLKESKMTNIPSQKILIIVLRAIGDVLLTTPLIRAIKKNIPGSRVYFLTGKASEKVLRYNPYLDGIIISGAGSVDELKRQKFDISIDFLNSAISGYYSLCSGAKRRIAFYRPWGFWCYNFMLKHSCRGYTVLDRLQMLEALNIKDDGIALDLKFTDAEEKKAHAFLEANNISDDDFLMTFDITNRRKHRQWPKEKFCKLADLIAGEFRAKIIFLWGPGELEYVKDAVSRCQKKHILCDNFDILESAALIKNCNMHVGTSSAPGHIAVSQNTPSFIIYGLKTDPANWTPPGTLMHRFIQGNLDSLSAEEVFFKLKNII